MIFRLPSLPPAAGAAKAGLASVLEGLAFLKGRHVILMTFALDIVAMVFGMPRALFPALAVHQFHGGLETAGWLYAAPAVGALLASLTGGWMSRVHKQGLSVVWAILAWGAAITLFGFSHSLLLGLVLPRRRRRRRHRQRGLPVDDPAERGARRHAGQAVRHLHRRGRRRPAPRRPRGGRRRGTGRHGVLGHLRRHRLHRADHRAGRSGAGAACARTPAESAKQDPVPVRLSSSRRRRASLSRGLRTVPSRQSRRSDAKARLSAQGLGDHGEVGDETGVRGLAVVRAQHG